MSSERIFQRNPGGPKVVDIAGHHGGTPRKGGGGDHQVGATVTDLLAQASPDAGVFSRERQNPVGEQLHRPVDPGSQVSRKSRVLPIICNAFSHLGTEVPRP